MYRKHPTGIVNLTFSSIEISHNLIKYYKFASSYFKEFNLEPIMKKHMSDRYYLMSKLYYNNNEMYFSCKYFLLAIIYNPSKVLKRVSKLL